MRLQLVGYTGTRPPVPGTTGSTGGGGGDPTSDPDFVPPEPLTVVFNDGDIFHKLDYLALGYNRFDVLCIGAGGGCGGGFNWHRGADGMRVVYGGAGGGGGAHRIKGRLALLPSSVPVVVGQRGASVPFIMDSSGGEGVSSPSGVGSITGEQPAAYAAATAALDGGFSSFGGDVCKASGGKGGLKGHYLPGVVGVVSGLGGQGGVGASITPGGGGGAEPTWNGIIGKGGAGGRGGARIYYDNPQSASVWTTQGANADYAIPDPAASAISNMNASNGVRGSYSSADTSLSASGVPRSTHDLFRTLRDMSTGSPVYSSGWDIAPIIPGGGGGATSFPIDGGLGEWGGGASMHFAGGANNGVGAENAGVGGFVVIRLTYLSL